jgi:hypothetical protein
MVQTAIRQVDPCGGGLEYLHRSPVGRKRRQKGNPVPGGITGPPWICFRPQMSSGRHLLCWVP